MLLARRSHRWAADLSHKVLHAKCGCVPPLLDLAPSACSSKPKVTQENVIYKRCLPMTAFVLTAQICAIEVMLVLLYAGRLSERNPCCKRLGRRLSEAEYCSPGLPVSCHCQGDC